jgi:hypothetical protein
LSINAAKNAAESVMKAKCPAPASRINSFVGALTRLPGFEVGERLSD